MRTINLNALVWPPAFRLRRSIRARYVRLQLCPHQGLLLVVPAKFDVKKTSSVLEQHRSWIERTWQRLAPQRLLQEPEKKYPQQLSLLAVTEIWKISYPFEEIEVANKIKKTTLNSIPHGKPRDFTHGESRGERAFAPLGREAANLAGTSEIKQENKIFSLRHLIFQGQHPEPREIKILLMNWLKEYATIILLPWLQRLSLQTGLTYAKASIRNASSRWGSCSIDKKISLNCKLLFLPPHLVEHVLLHELCHTRQLNHSRQFWNLLSQYDLNCHFHRKQLKQANYLVPSWLENDKN